MKTINNNDRSINMDEKAYEIRLLNFMEANGFILPESKNSIQSFITASEELEVEIPEAIKNPLEILKRGIVNPSKTFSIKCEDSQLIENNLAQAAREGREIPSHILMKMENKRNGAE